VNPIFVGSIGLRGEFVCARRESFVCGFEPFWVLVGVPRGQ
jgi:hypothetical protein